MSTASLPGQSPSQTDVPQLPRRHAAKAAVGFSAPSTDGSADGAAHGAALPAAKVLLVEDNVDDAELALHGLSRCGLGREVKWVRDGAEAVEWIEADAGRTLRLLLLDLRMPRMDGFEVLRRVKSNPAVRDTPVIVMASGHGAPELERCFELGADSYLVKPLEPEPLRAALRALDIRLE